MVQVKKKMDHHLDQRQGNEIKLTRMQYLTCTMLLDLKSVGGTDGTGKSTRIVRSRYFPQPCVFVLTIDIRSNLRMLLFFDLKYVIP